MTKKQLLHVRYHSGSGNPLVLLHGMFGDGTQWEKIEPLLTDTYRVIALDLLGHGASPRPKNAQYTRDEHVDALRNTLEKLQATENLTVVGYSMGGAVALSYCARYHDALQLYLISTPFYLDPKDMVDAGYSNSLTFTKLSTASFAFVEKLLRPGGILNTVLTKYDRPEWFIKMIGAYDNQLDPYIVQQNLRHLVREFPFIRVLRDVTAPVTFYAGKRDLFIVQRQIYALKKIKPYMDIERLDIVKVDHMLVQNLPREIAAMVSANAQQLLHVGYDEGQGSVIVLLHGIESSSGYWKGMAPTLAQKHRVVALDLLGFGDSPRPLNIAYSLEEQAVWVARTLSSMGIDTAHVVGHSLGALVSIALAALYPQLVSKLTLFSPVIIASKNTNRFILKRINVLNFFSDTNAIMTATINAVGEAKLKTYVPLLRSVTNAVNNQQAVVSAFTKQNIPTDIIYAANDPLVDASLVESFAKRLKHASCTQLPKSGHNLPMTDPAQALTFLAVDVSTTKVIKTKLPKPINVIRQLFRDSAPSMLVKSLVLLGTGLLLFSSHAKETLVLGLGLYVLAQGIKTIKGTFSLKNEGLSYISYVLLGGTGVIMAYVLVRHPTFSLKVSVLALCAFALLTGISKVVTGWIWTKDNRYLRNKEIITGTFLVLASSTAILLHSIVGVKLIVYAIAAILMLRALAILAHLSVIAGLAFVRGYK